MSNVETGVGTQDIILGLIWGDTGDWGGDTTQNSNTEGGGTPHKIKVGCWLAGGLAGSMIIVPILAPSCKLKLARFSVKLRIQDGAEYGN